MASNELTNGTKVFTTVRGRRMYGVIRGRDESSYYARVCGREVYKVFWFGGVGFGGGWSRDELTVA